MGREPEWGGVEEEVGTRMSTQVRSEVVDGYPDIGAGCVGW